LTVWDCDHGILLAQLKFHKSSITGIKSLNCESGKNNLIVVSSIDKILTVWNTDTYELEKTTKFSSNAFKLFLNLKLKGLNDLILVAGMDLKIYDHNLDLLDEYFRKTNENSLKYIIDMENDQFVVATNYDIESYSIVTEKIVADSYENQKSTLISDEKLEKKIKLRAENREKNVHRESILSLSKVSDAMFVSSSSDGLFILWNCEDLKKLIVLKPVIEFQNEVLSLTKASSVKRLTDVTLILRSKI